MTVISDKLLDGAKVPAGVRVEFWIPRMRDANDSSAILVEDVVTVPVVAATGAFTTPNLEPGRWRVRIVWSALETPAEYEITIPSSTSTIRLWPLVDAAAPPPAATIPGFVRNAGGINRTQFISTTAYAALTAPDPTTLYITYTE